MNRRNERAVRVNSQIPGPEGEGHLPPWQLPRLPEIQVLPSVKMLPRGPPPWTLPFLGRRLTFIYSRYSAGDVRPLRVVLKLT